MADALYLPEDIVRLIFLRMPRKPLFQLKCVSKHWNRLISDHFITLRSRRMIFLPSLPFHAIDNTATSEEIILPMIKLSSPSINMESYKEVTIVGSFNGIVLLVLEYLNPNYGRHMILYNPLSGEYNTVPRGQSYESYNNYLYGFGYGTAADDLKIIRLKYYPYPTTVSKSFEVFSLKTWSWSRPSKLTGDSCFDSTYSGIFANGFLYWTATRKSGSSLYLIVTLNIKTMKFSRRQVPDGYQLRRLGTLKGQLCMICSQYFAKGYELRVMNEQWSWSWDLWSTVCWFDPSSLLPIDLASHHGMLCILDDGRLLTLKSCNQLIIYDMFKDSYVKVDNLTSFIRVGKLHSVEYIQSLISPSDISSVFI